MIRVLVVEDSPVVREMLIHILSSSPDIEVIGTAGDGEEAVRAVRDKRPDIVTMDIVMPKMDGFEATRLIMEKTPVPIVIVSASWNRDEVGKTFQAIKAGAVAAVRKPVGIVHPDYQNQAKELIQTVKLMSEIKVVRRRLQKIHRTDISEETSAGAQASVTIDIEVVAIGASTGGPPAIETILSGLPKKFHVPILIVQHIAVGFVQGFADWLSNASGFSVKIAENGEHPQPGVVYIAPDDFQMSMSITKRISLDKSEPENGLRPSVSCLFRSVAEVFGKNAAGVLLTGMGKDGAYELKLMREQGAVTIAQDRKSSVVFGMPGEAIAINAATYIFPPAKIAEFLSGLVKMGE